MWISRKWKKDIERYIIELRDENKSRKSEAQTLQTKYDRLLDHLGLVEWIEAPKDAVPAKTVLITKKEQKKRNKNKQVSYSQPTYRSSLTELMRQQRDYYLGMQQQSPISPFE